MYKCRSQGAFWAAVILLPPLKLGRLNFAVSHRTERGALAHHGLMIYVASLARALAADLLCKKYFTKMLQAWELESVVTELSL
jgi:hypothetical protein